MKEVHFLNNIFSSKDFNESELKLILCQFKQVNFSKSEYLLKEGKTENHYWFLERGFVRSFVNDTCGNDITTNFYGQSDIVIDWSSFFLRNPTRENIQALTDCICWQLDFETFPNKFHFCHRATFLPKPTDTFVFVINKIKSYGNNFQSKNSRWSDRPNQSIENNQQCSMGENECLPNAETLYLERRNVSRKKTIQTPIYGQIIRPNGFERNLERR